MIILNNRKLAESPDDGGESGSNEGAPEETEVNSPETKTEEIEENINQDSKETEAGDIGEEGASDFKAFDMPEGMEVDEELVNIFSPVMSEIGLTQEQAQKLANAMAGQVAGQIEKQQGLEQTQFQDKINGWLAKTKADEQIGGDLFNESLIHAQKSVKEFGTPAFTEMLNETGIGNHPEMVRFMYAVGKATQEDDPGSAGNQISKAKTDLEILYPKN